MPKLKVSALWVVLATLFGTSTVFCTFDHDSTALPSDPASGRPEGSPLPEAIEPFPYSKPQ